MVTGKRLSFSLPGILAVTLLISACAPTSTTSTGATVSTLASLAAYDAVQIEPLFDTDGKRDPWGLEPEVAAAFRRSGVRVYDFEDPVSTPEEFERTMAVFTNFRWSGDTVIFDLTLTDALGGRLHRVQTRATARLDYNAAVRSAAAQAAAEASAAYPGYDPAAVNPVSRTIASWPRRTITEAQIREDISSRTDVDPIEGIWNGDYYRFAIIPDPQTGPGQYVGVILTAQLWNWRSGMVKLAISASGTDGRYAVNWFMGDFSSVRRTAQLRPDGSFTISLPTAAPGRDENATYSREFPFVAASSDPPPARSETESSVSTGSGFLVSRSGHVVTNAHVVEDRDEIEVRLREGDVAFPARVVIRDRDNDLAVLQLLGFNYDDVFAGPIPYSLGSSTSVDVGDRVLALGFPLGEILGRSMRVTNGIISSNFGVGDKPNVLQITNAVQPGNSGGPLLSERGEIIGVVVSSLNAGYFLDITGTVPQNVNFAVKAAYVRALLAMVPGADELTGPPANYGAGTGNAALVRDVTDYVAAVRAQ